MDVIHQACAGLDVHQDTVVACVRLVRQGRVWREVQTFSTTTRGLMALRDWLVTSRCTHAAMESTGVYWKPVWHVLEGSLELLLANAAHIKGIPGRKTDVNDAMWIADLLAHGLIRGSFVPPEPIQDLRDLTRTRTRVLAERSQHVQRIQKTLEDANVKLTGLVTDVLGVTGRALIEGLIDGVAITEEYVQQHRRHRLKASNAELVEALTGRVRDHHRFLLGLHLHQYDELTAVVSSIEQRIDGLLGPYRETVENLKTIPGVKDATARILLAEVGPDMSRFPTSGHLVSWAGMCPGNNESAGKRKASGLRDGSRWLRTALVQAAWPASKKKGSYLRGQYHRLKARRGAKKAIVAVGASILTAAYHMLARKVPYQELGEHFHDDRNRQSKATSLIRRLREMGLHVEVRPAA